MKHLVPLARDYDGFPPALTAAGGVAPSRICAAQHRNEPQSSAVRLAGDRQPSTPIDHNPWQAVLDDISDLRRLSIGPYTDKWHFCGSIAL